MKEHCWQQDFLILLFQWHGTALCTRDKLNDDEWAIYCYELDVWRDNQVKACAAKHLIGALGKVSEVVFWEL